MRRWAIARGRAKVRFGGEKGREIDLMPGDVVVLPAGTGHQCLSQTPTLVVIGAYPPTGQYNLCRGSKSDHAKALATIPKVPPPATDPVFGPKVRCSSSGARNRQTRLTFKLITDRIPSTVRGLVDKADAGTRLRDDWLLHLTPNTT